MTGISLTKFLKDFSFRTCSFIFSRITNDQIHILHGHKKPVFKISYTSGFLIKYMTVRHHAYHPCIMCKILIQSMLDRVRSSRAIARNVRENIVYMYLAENLQPDFRTISDFRKENE